MFSISDIDAVIIICPEGQDASPIVKKCREWHRIPFIHIGELGDESVQVCIEKARFKGFKNVCILYHNVGIVSGHANTWNVPDDFGILYLGHEIKEGRFHSLDALEVSECTSWAMVVNLEHLSKQRYALSNMIFLPQDRTIEAIYAQYKASMTPKIERYVQMKPPLDIKVDNETDLQLEVVLNLYGKQVPKKITVRLDMEVTSLVAFYEDQETLEYIKRMPLPAGDWDVIVVEEGKGCIVREYNGMDVKVLFSNVSGIYSHRHIANQSYTPEPIVFKYDKDLVERIGTDRNIIIQFDNYADAASYFETFWHGNRTCQIVASGDTPFLLINLQSNLDKIVLE